MSPGLVCGPWGGGLYAAVITKMGGSINGVGGGGGFAKIDLAIWFL